MTDDSKRAWILVYEWRGARTNVLCRGVHPLTWLARQAGKCATLLWYAEVDPGRAEIIRAGTCVEIADAT
jgi:hypothetical protein